MKAVIMQTGCRASCLSLGSKVFFALSAAATVFCASAQASGAMDAAVVRVLISPAQETTLVAAMNGQVKELSMTLGSAFSTGALLLAFDCAENKAKEKIARAELKGARDNLNGKSRLRKLQAAGDMEVSLAQAAVDKGVGQLELAQAQVGQCAVKAPFGGRVARLHVKQYQGVNAGTPLADVISDGPLKMRLNAPSSWLGRLRVGMPFEVSVDETGKRYPARVSAMGARVDAAAQAIEVEGQFEGAFPELLAGMSGTVHFPDSQ